MTTKAGERLLHQTLGLRITPESIDAIKAEARAGAFAQRDELLDDLTAEWKTKVAEAVRDALTDLRAAVPDIVREVRLARTVEEAEAAVIAEIDKRMPVRTEAEEEVLEARRHAEYVHDEEHGEPEMCGAECAPFLDFGPEAEYDPDEPEEAARLDAVAKVYFAERRKEEAMQVVEWLREALGFDDEWGGIARSLVLTRLRIAEIDKRMPGGATPKAALMTAEQMVNAAEAAWNSGKSRAASNAPKEVEHYHEGCSKGDHTCPVCHGPGGAG